MGLLLDAMRGGVAGGAATWFMDLVTTGVYEQQPADATARELAARPNGKTTIANLVDRVEQRTGMTIPPEQRPAVEHAAHYALGVVPGALYGIVRSRVPGVGLLRGLGYGAILWAVNDEWLNTKLGLAGPPEAYPSEAHMRGLVGHLALGGATDTFLALLGG
jgi:hypothetical protein